jgi:hypothetical protein
MPHAPLTRAVALSAVLSTSLPFISHSTLAAGPAARAARAARTAKPPKALKPAQPARAPAPNDKDGWRPLFDSKSLANWNATSFGAEGPVRVKDGQILIEAGDPLTGITWAGGALPSSNYEIALEAMRVRGGDFFCALTFTVDKAPLTLVVGGWGGNLVGVSTLDDRDASENETTTQMVFADKRWYRIRVRVEPTRLQAWIDDRQVADVKTAGRKLTIRPEMEESRPLGVATYRTTAALRAIRLRDLGAGAAP